MAGGGAPDWDDLVLVGVIARPRGIRGEVIVNPVTDFPEERFAEGAVLQVRRAGSATTETLTIRTARLHLGRPVVQFEGLDSIDAAQVWAGAELRIHPGEQHALPDGVYYHSQLVGCAVVTEGGAEIGTVTAVDGETSNSRLVVRGRRGEVLIPLVEAICPEVDVEGRRIVVRPPEGLLDVNVARWTADAPGGAPPETGPGGA
ncbi:MAG: ribosome maturation factor RimM [Vicinamibacterales bacterium]|nr:ribosome maturation factor RimM [Vicinamibacterales bacterium]